MQQSSQAAKVVGQLGLCAGNVNERGMLLLFSTLEIILQCFPKEGPGLLQPALQRLLVLLLADKESGLTVSSKLVSGSSSWHQSFVLQQCNAVQCTVTLEMQVARCLPHVLSATFSNKCSYSHASMLGEVCVRPRRDCCASVWR